MQRPGHAIVKFSLFGTTLSFFVVALLGIINRTSSSAMICTGFSQCLVFRLIGLGELPFFPLLHQTFGMIAGLSMIVTIGVTYKVYKDQKQMVVPLLFGVLFLILQGTLPLFFGGEGNADWTTGLHFLIALIVLGSSLIPLVYIHLGQNTSFSILLKTFSWLFKNNGLLRLTAGTSLAIFLLLLSGIFVSVTDASQACLAWPVCLPLGEPESLLGWLDFFHRLMTFVSVLMMARLVIKTWREFRDQTAVLVLTTISAVLFFSQALMGAVESARGYPAYLIALHSATSISVWVSMVSLTTLVWVLVPQGAALKGEIRGVERRSLKRILLDYLMLTKPVVVLLLLVTTVAGMVVGGKSWPPFPTLAWTLFAGFLAAGGSSAINQYIDRFDDLKMQRTRKRPLPSGRLTPAEGLAFGVASVIISFYLMVSLVNLVAALLTLAGIIYYVLIYSILLKKTTVQNIVIGGGAGAIPPLVGWAAVTGGLNIPAMLLFAVVFLWTPPHFWALALVRRKDYARAGVPMLPVVRGERETRWQIFLYTLQLVVLTLLLPVFGLGGSLYLVGAVVLGVYLLLFAWRVWKKDGNKVAWQMYRHSSMYLAFLFLVMMFDALIQ
jgi:protoheme IX farnesyltransferase